MFSSLFSFLSQTCISCCNAYSICICQDTLYSRNSSLPHNESYHHYLHKHSHHGRCSCI
uniref:Secreted protein n=1 Tax=Anguilla anguilla TaxID=7936 RepID=A0A0E9Y039_ANGAN